MDLTEKMVTSQQVFKGRILDVRVDKVALPNGRQSTREIVHHPGGVAILALDGEGRVLTVTQYRYAYGKMLLEIPAGKLEPGEDPREAAVRELREETGAVAGCFEPLGEIYPSPGYCDEIIRLYLARDLTFGDTDPDEDEFLTLWPIPFPQMVEKILAGEITDAKTVAAVLKAKVLLGL